MMLFTFCSLQNAKEARKYNSSSRMVGVQREITERAIELLRLPEDRPSFVLDVGCGSGLSGQVRVKHLGIYNKYIYESIWS
jgi:18S rRNA (guanine1575-N7)-methyltransferase